MNSQNEGFYQFQENKQKQIIPFQTFVEREKNVLFVIKTHFNQLQTAIYFCIQIRMSMYGYY